MPDERQELLDKLKELGERHSLQRDQRAVLKTEITKAVARAKELRVNMNEVAELLRLDRTSIYQTYARPRRD